MNRKDKIEQYKASCISSDVEAAPRTRSFVEKDRYLTRTRRITFYPIDPGYDSIKVERDYCIDDLEDLLFKPKVKKKPVEKTTEIKDKGLENDKI